jgi:hypothetical protein
MASIISAGTTSGTSLNLSGDTSGVLQLASNGSTTAVTIDTSQNVIINGTTALNTSAGRGNITINGSSDAILSFGVAGVDQGYIYHNGTDIQFDNSKNGYIRFATNGTERMRVLANGTIQTVSTVSVGNATPSTSGAGITFPATQSASSDANTLDDYEEGTWTPSFTLDSGSATATSASGSYVKIGRQVSVTVFITFSVPSAANVNDITGLPFTVENTNQRGVGAVRENGNTGFMWQLRANVNATSANLRRYDNAQALADGMSFIGTLTYFTS